MPKGIAHLSVIPVRKEPSEKSEMVTQILFGEVYEVIKTVPGWINIKIIYDDYVGWISENMFEEIQENEHTYLVEKPILSILDMSNKSPVYLNMASRIPLKSRKKNRFTVGSHNYTIDWKNIPEFPENKSPLFYAKQYLNTPYLWGGRTIFGIDCSALVQNSFMLCGISLPRDAYQQAETGNPVTNLKSILPNDLAFFKNKEGKIIHVGILISSSEIIHASGKVRIDKFDNTGIFNKEVNKYTHILAKIKRVTKL